MVFQSFSVNFLIVIFFLNVLKEAQMQTTTIVESSSATSSMHIGPSGTTYNTEIHNGELGIRIAYNPKAQNPQMSVTIYYDTENTSATDFFKTQLTDQVFQDFTACGVLWSFMPCGTSKFGSNGVLTCLLGENQCTFDKIHACVATMSAQDQLKVGQFVICFFNNNKNVDLCLGKIGLNSADVNTCAGPQGQGANVCNTFNTQIHPNGSPAPPPGTSTGTATTEGTSNFKGVLCNLFANNRLQCSACQTAPPSGR